MSEVIISGSLLPSASNTPIDARTYVNTEGDIVSIKKPFVEMPFCVRDTGKWYVVKSLKRKSLGLTSVEVVDSYVPLFPGLSNYASNAGTVTGEASGGKSPAASRADHVHRGSLPTLTVRFGAEVESIGSFVFNIQSNFAAKTPFVLDGQFEAGINSLLELETVQVHLFTDSGKDYLSTKRYIIPGEGYAVDFSDYLMFILMGSSPGISVIWFLPKYGLENQLPAPSDWTGVNFMRWIDPTYVYHAIDTHTDYVCDNGTFYAKNRS